MALFLKFPRGVARLIEEFAHSACDAEFVHKYGHDVRARMVNVPVCTSIHDTTHPADAIRYLWDVPDATQLKVGMSIYLHHRHGFGTFFIMGITPDRIWIYGSDGIHAGGDVRLVDVYIQLFVEISVPCPPPLSDGDTSRLWYPYVAVDPLNFGPNAGMSISKVVSVPFETAKADAIAARVPHPFSQLS